VSSNFAVTNPFGRLTSNWERQLESLTGKNTQPSTSQRTPPQQAATGASAVRGPSPAATVALGGADPDELALVYKSTLRAQELQQGSAVTFVGAAPAAIGAPLTDAFEAFSATTSGSHAISTEIDGGVDLSSNPNKVSVTLDNVAKGAEYTVTSSFSLTAGARAKVYAIDDQTGRRFTLGSTGGTFTAKTSGSYTLEYRSFKGTFAGTLTSTVYGDAALPNKSGNKLVDALLAGSDHFWQDTTELAGGNAISSDDGTLITRGLTSLNDAAHRATITYGFLTGAPTVGSADEQANGTAMGVLTQAAVNAAFDYYEQLFNVTFVAEAVTEYDGTNPDDATDIIFGLTPQDSSNGYAYYPNGSYAKDSTYVMLNDEAFDEGTMAATYVDPGYYGWTTIIHEIGHALGLKHPGNYNAGGGGTPPPYLPSAYDSSQYSMMSYYSNPNGARYDTGIAQSAKILDIAALQYLYGVNDAGSTADGGEFVFDGTMDYNTTLWSKNGTDTIVLDGLTNGSTVNLNDGEFSSIDFSGDLRARDYSGYNNVSIAYGAQINNVELSTNAAEDVVILNDAFKDDAFDAITNFDAADDQIGLSKKIFGKLSRSSILIEAGATEATSRRQKIIVDSTTGDIYYDRDGSGTRYAVEKIGNIDDTTGLTSGNFKFVA
jgi:hypothetical protein